MSWLGKILGGGIGFALGGPLGGVMGAVLGHQFDASKGSGSFLSSIENKQSIYFAAVFSMLGKLAKADGYVSQAEVDVIDRVMRENLRLDAQARKLAIEIFNTAKDSDASFESFALQFQQEFGAVKAVKESLIDLLLMVAFADGQIHPTEEKLLLEAVRIFQLEDRYKQLRGRLTGNSQDLGRCYEILSSQPDDDLKAIKARYRKLAMEYHPDRVQANGMSPELAQVAEEKFKEIQNAFDVIEKHKRASG
jgi:DnaJ like chaperone protein